MNWRENNQAKVSVGFGAEMAQNPFCRALWAEIMIGAESEEVSNEGHIILLCPKRDQERKAARHCVRVGDTCACL